MTDVWFHLPTGDRRDKQDMFNFRDCQLTAVMYVFFS